MWTRQENYCLLGCDRSVGWVVHTYRRFEGNFCIHLYEFSSTLDMEVTASPIPSVLWTCEPDYTEWHRRKKTWPPWETKISQRGQMLLSASEMDKHRICVCCNCFTGIYYNWFNAPESHLITLHGVSRQYVIPCAVRTINRCNSANLFVLKWHHVRLPFPPLRNENTGDNQQTTAGAK
jgi:hypothetical protein